MIAIGTDRVAHTGIEVGEQSVKKISTLTPKAPEAPFKVTPGALSQAQVILTEEEEQQVLKDAAEFTGTLTEEDEKELLKSVEAVAAETGEEASDRRMDQEEVDNDDLLEEELQISVDRTLSDPIIPPSRRNRVAAPTSPLPISSHSPSSRRPAKERIEYPSPPLPKSAHRKRKAELKKSASRGPRELRGISTRKRNAIHLQGSPSKRLAASTTTGKQKKKLSSSHLPHTGVFPSAVSKKPKSQSGLVGSQNPPSKHI